MTPGRTGCTSGQTNTFGRGSVRASKAVCALQSQAEREGESRCGLSAKKKFGARVGRRQWKQTVAKMRHAAGESH